MAIDCLTAGILVADHLSAPIARLPAAGELVLADTLPLSIGGCAANVATDLARLGTRVGVVGCVGQDAFGRYIAETLEASGVATDGLLQRAGVETSGTLIINVAGEDRRFIHAIGASATFTAADFPVEIAKQAKVLYLGGYLLMPALEAEPLASVLAEVRAAGVKTLLDVVVPDESNHWPSVAPLLPHLDVFLPNVDEARALSGLADPQEQARRFRDAGASTVVITCGDAGTVLLSDSHRVRAAIYPTDFVGGTGAGDAFAAGYIAGLLDGSDELDCLRMGSALGASCVASVSATGGVFSRAQAEQFLADNTLSMEDL